MVWKKLSESILTLKSPFCITQVTDSKNMPFHPGDIVAHAVSLIAKIASCWTQHGVVRTSFRTKASNEGVWSTRTSCASSFAPSQSSPSASSGRTSCGNMADSCTRWQTSEVLSAFGFQRTSFGPGGRHICWAHNICTHTQMASSLSPLGRNRAKLTCNCGGLWRDSSDPCRRKRNSSLGSQKLTPKTKKMTK